MTRIVSLSAALAAFVLAPAALADDAGEAETIKSDGNIGGTPAKLVSFDGEHKFLKTSTRLRVWRPEVGFTIKVSAEGNPTDCELTHKFRRTYVNKTLCEVLMEHHQFEPAHDASGMPTEGSYTARLNYLDLRAKQ